jgi:hypothetical protein
MASLDLKSITRAAFAAIDKRAKAGDQEALDWFRSIWDEADPPNCFLCDAVISGERAIDGKPFAMILPETSGWDGLILAPLCRRCRDLDKSVRISRGLRMLRAMHKQKTGRNVGFMFNVRR